VRRGLLYSLLDRPSAQDRCSPPPNKLNVLRSRARPREELIAWTTLMASSGLDERPTNGGCATACPRCRHRLRAHPDIRRASLNIIANATSWRSIIPPGV